MFKQMITALSFYRGKKKKRESVLFRDQQAAAAYIAVIEAAQYFKAAVFVFFTQVLRGNEGTGIDIGAVDHVNGPGLSVCRG